MTTQEREQLLTAKENYKKLKSNKELYNKKRLEMLSWFADQSVPNWGSLIFKPCN